MSARQSSSHVPPARLHPGSYPIALPHYRFDEEGLWFGRERGRDARGGEAAFATSCDGRQPFAAVAERVQGARLHAATARYLAWWHRPLAEAPPEPPPRARTIVLAPHPDDAELSMGGWLLQQEAPEACLIVVCFATLSHSIAGTAFPDACSVSQVRWDEALTASRMLHMPVLPLKYPEFGIRHGLTPAPVRVAREVHTSAVLKRRLYTLLENHQPERVFAPAALGGHPDHRMLFDIALEFCDEDFFPETRFDLYEEAPYAARYQTVDDFLARFENAYLEVSPWSCPVESLLPNKRALAGVFRSQFKTPIRDVIVSIARRNGAREIPGEGRPGAACEVFWHLDALSGLADAF